MAFRSRRQPRWTAALLAVLFGLAAVANGLTIASSDEPASVGQMLGVLAWAFVSGLNVGDLIIPVSKVSDGSRG